MQILRYLTFKKLNTYWATSNVRYIHGHQHLKVCYFTVYSFSLNYSSKWLCLPITRWYSDRVFNGSSAPFIYSPGTRPVVHPRVSAGFNSILEAARHLGCSIVSRWCLLLAERLSLVMATWKWQWEWCVWRRRHGIFFGWNCGILVSFII